MFDLLTYQILVKQKIVGSKLVANWTSPVTLYIYIYIYDHTRDKLKNLGLF